MSSSTPPTPDQTIRDTAQLSELLAAGCKPKADWRIGTEHEKFVFCRTTRRPLPYEGSPGIGELLEAFAEQYDWEPVSEAGKVIALKRDGGSITLEPGGQLELSGAPLENIHQTCGEVHAHLRQVKALAKDMQVGFLGLGFCPDWRREEIPWMPKRRYEIMGNYMPKVGTLGHDMMLRTCTVQVNLDFASEADMVRKFRVALALQPVATALFANSPFTEGKPNGFVSRRSAVWEDTDDDRCGMLDFVFDADMGFERYVEYMLDVPMYFVMRDGKMIDCTGQSFRDFMAGKLPALPGERPLISDFQDHLTTAFPEARLKTFLEMRGADAGPWSNLCALPAFWVGLLYDETALDAAWQLCADWTTEQRAALRHQTPREGLDTPTPDGRDMHALASDVLRISEDGLRRRARQDGRGRDETMFLQPLWQTIERRETPAEELLRRYHREWGERTDPLYDFYAY